MCGEGKAILVPSGGALQNFAEEAKSTDPLCLERVSPGKGFANRVLWKSRGWGTAFFTEDSFKDASAMLVGMKRGISVRWKRTVTFTEVSRLNHRIYPQHDSCLLKLKN